MRGGRKKKEREELVKEDGERNRKWFVYSGFSSFYLINFISFLVPPPPPPPPPPPVILLSFQRRMCCYLSVYLHSLRQH